MVCKIFFCCAPNPPVFRKSWPEVLAIPKHFCQNTLLLQENVIKRWKVTSQISPTQLIWHGRVSIIETFLFNFVAAYYYLLPE